jgi:hypothetical protein
MKRLLAICAVACVVLVLPCFLFANPDSGDDATPYWSGLTSDSVPGAGNGDNQTGSAARTEGDPDELGGGFRGSEEQPNSGQDIDTTPGGILNSLVSLFISLV